MLWALSQQSQPWLDYKRGPLVRIVLVQGVHFNRFGEGVPPHFCQLREAGCTSAGCLAQTRGVCSQKVSENNGGWKGCLGMRYKLAKLWRLWMGIQRHWWGRPGGFFVEWTWPVFGVGTVFLAELLLCKVVAKEKESRQSPEDSCGGDGVHSPWRQSGWTCGRDGTGREVHRVGARGGQRPLPYPSES